MSVQTYDIPGFLYAAVVLSGGAMGFIKKGSVASLAAGGISGVLLGYGAWDPKDVRISIAVSAILVLVMGSRFARSGKFMPAGLVSVCLCSPSPSIPNVCFDY
ncbi:uncharacterized protein EHS24_006272 [Apiotrichum porosum]|uniref:Transmembrane protein 14C n=1 Tax=Apiotrichum porosum TaxID=105984 RepID=A0A427Y0U9_9TREE|nr:uncharacterized protein EHS24_006272 [Apiotrichum porosum]RSH84748.1 hypothetical protein EHS24_006272 [Apiotrichum porosum]